MRLAIARGVLWFFGSIIFMLVFFREALSKMANTEQYLSLLFIGLVVGGAVLGYTWYSYEQEEHDLKLEERRKALKSKTVE